MIGGQQIESVLESLPVEVSAKRPATGPLLTIAHRVSGLQFARLWKVDHGAMQ